MVIQKQQSFGRIVHSFIEVRGVDKYLEAKKPCTGYSCYYCRPVEACTDGDTDLLFIPGRELCKMVTQESAYILDLPGSNIEAPNKTS